MSMSIESLQQQQHILANSGDLLSSLSNVYNNISPEALAQLLRSSQDYASNDNLPSSANNNTPSNNSTQYLGDLFHNSQVFKGFPDGIYSYLNTNKNNEGSPDRSSVGTLPPTENNKFFKWTGNVDDQQSKMSADHQDHALPPLHFSPGDNLTGTPYSVVQNINSQGTISIDDEEDDFKVTSDGKKRASSDEGMPVMDGEKAVKKKRRQEKNREAAQLFRQRQKAKVHELERSVDELTCNNSEFRMKMEILIFENKILKDQLFYLKNLVSSGILITSVPTFPPVSNAEKPELPTLMHTGSNSTTPVMDNTTLTGNNSTPFPVSRGSPFPVSTTATRTHTPPPHITILPPSNNNVINNTSNNNPTEESRKPLRV